MNNITKDIFLNSIDCPRRAWLMMREKEEGTASELSAAERMRMDEGREIGIRARKLYPEGKLIEEKSLKSAIQATGASLSNNSLPALFEAAFLHGNLTARADIIEREGSRWHLIEVKSGKEASAEYIADIAYTMTVLRMAGLPIVRASLMCVSSDYRLSMTDEALFSYFDVTAKAVEMSDHFTGECPNVCQTLASPSTPAPVWKPACKGCAYFKNCTGAGIINPIFDLPRISPETIERLAGQGIHAIEDIPASFALSTNQRIVVNAVKTLKQYKSGELKSVLDSIVWPAYYLDFETITTALPLFENVAPYEQMLTQYSLHICSAPGKIDGNREYLASHERDCRRELAVKLIEDLGESGSIIVYHTFEKTMLSGLAKLFPDLKSDLDKIIDRLVDLKAIINKHYYHPGFHGSYSIKVVLPTLVPDMSYKELAIQNGSEAIAAFVDMAKRRIDGSEADKIRAELLEYCALDTMAMVRLHERLIELSRFQV